MEDEAGVVELNIDEVKRNLFWFNRMLAAALVVALMLLGYVISQRAGAGGQASGLLLVALVGAGVGGLLALWLSALESEQGVFRATLTAVTSAVGGTVLFDLGNRDGMLRGVVTSAAAGCGLRPGTSLVVAVFAAFMAISCLWLYVNKKAWINSLIARGTAHARRYDAYQTSAPRRRNGGDGAGAPGGPDGPAPADGDGARSTGVSGDGTPAERDDSPGVDRVELLERIVDTPLGPTGGADPQDRGAPSADVAANDDDSLHSAYAGRESSDGLRITARVTETDDPDWFDVYVVVASRNPQTPLTGTVAFQLHPTFSPAVVTKVIAGGRASIRFRAWGAFTLGADVLRADQRVTRLGIDLAQLTDAPKRFRER